MTTMAEAEAEAGGRGRKLRGGEAADLLGNGTNRILGMARRGRAIDRHRIPSKRNADAGAADGGAAERYGCRCGGQGARWRVCSLRASEEPDCHESWKADPASLPPPPPSPCSSPPCRALPHRAAPSRLVPSASVPPAP